MRLAVWGCVGNQNRVCDYQNRSWAIQSLFGKGFLYPCDNSDPPSTLLLSVSFLFGLFILDYSTRFGAVFQDRLLGSRVPNGHTLGHSRTFALSRTIPHHQDIQDIQAIGRQGHSRTFREMNRGPHGLSQRWKAKQIYIWPRFCFSVGSITLTELQSISEAQLFHSKSKLVKPYTATITFTLCQPSSYLDFFFFFDLS